MPLFDVPLRPSKTADFATAKKVSGSSKQSPATPASGGGLLAKIKAARLFVAQNLAKFEELCELVTTEDRLSEYVDACIRVGKFGFDTETNGLEPETDELVGFSLYTAGEKAIYVPINHVSYITGEKCANQMPMDAVTRQLTRLLGTYNYMFHASFDIRVIMNWAKLRMMCNHDAYLGARLLNENEKENNLKYLHHKYCEEDNGEKAFTYDDYFDGMPFSKVPIDVGFVYAALDAKKTYELGEFQVPFLDANNEQCQVRELEEVSNVMYDLEMPCVDVIVDLEKVGVALDKEKAAELSVKYHKMLDDAVAEAYEIVDRYSDQIAKYNALNPGKLSNPIKLNSPKQLSILLFDVIGIEEPIDPKTKKPTRSTGEKILEMIEHPLVEKILKYREIDKLLGTYIDKLPTCVTPDGRIHCKFNQYGADTGRMSSSEPNLQNIPSKNHDIRQMFVATDGYVLMSADYSQQEPKCLAALCRRDGDTQMYDVFMAGKDLYSEIASKAFNVPYEECREFRPDGTTNKEGKERRSQAKSILLGINYGRGVASIADQLGTTVKKAQDIKDAVFKGFPAIKKFEAKSIRMAETLGYVTTVMGRKRRLPSMQLPDYEIVWKDGVAPDGDPLDFEQDTPEETEVPEAIQRKWLEKLKRTPFKQKRQVFEAANEEGIWIIDHTRDKDTTKVVNARIQGSAADLTKAAMINLRNNERLRELGFRMLIPVHDEVIAECPIENVKECSELMAQVMCDAASKILDMPIKCDVAISERWYGEEIKI